MAQKIELSFHAYAPQAADLSERELRVQLAAAYRLIDRFQMSDLIYTHISVRLPGPEHHFLINPFGLMFHEVTASSLIKVDIDGNIVGDSEWRANPAGFVIHSAIHAARQDLQCVVHTHTRDGIAVSALDCGLLPISQFSMQFYNRVAYHNYEGVALSLAERDRLVQDLGDKKIMILRNHGLLTGGCTIPEAFILMFYLNRACEVQITAQSAGTPLTLPDPAVCELAATQLNYANQGQLEWSALTRMLDREDPSYRN
jgi:ribulose-5-phosphate 4-epimerase/fuculose-1-phosphate aldolase